MNKYLIYLSVGDVEERTEEELVAVELGNNYADVEQRLFDAINADLSELPESKGCEVMCVQLDEGDGEDVLEFVGVIMHPSAPKDIVLHYSVRVEQA